LNRKAEKPLTPGRAASPSRFAGRLTSLLDRWKELNSAQVSNHLSLAL